MSARVQNVEGIVSPRKNISSVDPPLRGRTERAAKCQKPRNCGSCLSMPTRACPHTDL